LKAPNTGIAIRTVAHAENVQGGVHSVAYGVIFVEEFYTFTKRGTENALFLLSATNSTFCCSAKIK